MFNRVRRYVEEENADFFSRVTTGMALARSVPHVEFVDICFPPYTMLKPVLGKVN
jgi:hypothetical protein